MNELFYGLLDGLDFVHRLPNEEQDHWAARRAAHLLASLCIRTPSELSVLMKDIKDRDLAWWVWSFVLLRIIRDPYFFVLVASDDEHIVRFVTDAFYTLARKSLGIKGGVISEGGEIQGRQLRLGDTFPGPQLPLLYEVERLPTGLDLIAPAVVSAVEQALPALLTLAGQCRHQVPSLDGLIDYVARLRTYVETSVSWYQLLSDVQPDAYLLLCKELSSAYPYLDLATLLSRSRDACVSGSPFESVRQFDLIVIDRMLEFVNLQLRDSTQPVHRVLWAIDQGCATMRMALDLAAVRVPFEAIGLAITELDSVVLRIAGLELCEQSMLVALERWEAEQAPELKEVSREIAEFILEQGRAVVKQLSAECVLLGIDVHKTTDSVLLLLPESALNDDDHKILHEVRNLLDVDPSNGVG